MLNSAYKGVVFYFLPFIWLLLISALALYAQKIGFTPQAVLDYYTPKTLGGVLKVNLPHIFVFGLLSMVMLHFVVFTQHQKQLKLLNFIIYISGFMELFSPVGIIFGVEFFSYVKLISFFVFNGGFFYISLLLMHSIITE